MPGPGCRRLGPTRADIVRLDAAFVCPVTARLRPYAPGGVSLNAPGAALAMPVAMPRLLLPRPMGPTAEERALLRSWDAKAPAIAGRRVRAPWSESDDRVAEAAPFLRAQEHSAQIDRLSPKAYEDAFRAGRINVLNCSTTVAMCVDIADVGVVVNTKVPPATANRRQRVGRAGRRSEPLAFSLTFCKDTPLDRVVWADLTRLLGATVPTPKIRLASAVIVQRHVNALLLGLVLRDGGGVCTAASRAFSRWT